MLFSIGLLIVNIFFAFKVASVEKYEPLLTKAGDYDHAIHSDHPEASSLLDQYLQAKSKRKTKTCVAPEETAPGDGEGKKDYAPRETSAGISSPFF